MREFLRKLTLKLGRKYTIEDNWKDSAPSPNRKLDLILEFLIEKYNQPVTYIEIFEALKLKNVTLANVVRGIQKEINDGYVLKYTDKLESFYITHDGEEFIKDGGYISYQFWQFWRDKDVFDKFHKLATIILTLVALYFAFQNLNLKGRVAKLEETISELNASVYHLNQIKPQEPPKVSNTIILPDTLFIRTKTKINASK